MVDRANETRQHAPFGQGGEGIGADAVLGMEDVEATTRGFRKMRHIIVDPLPDEIGRCALGRLRLHGDGFASCWAEEAALRRVGRVHGDMIAKHLQGIAKRERVHDPATRIGRMGKNGDAQGPVTGVSHRLNSLAALPLQPVNALTPKSQMTASLSPSLSRTFPLASVPPT